MGVEHPRPSVIDAGATRREAAEHPLAGPPSARRAPTCVLIASRNGAPHLGAVVATAAQQAPTYVVSDASTDETPEVARRAGARVLELADNLGKPAALNVALRHFGLVERYDTVVVIDDDTTLRPGFVEQCLRRMRGGVAIVVGSTTSDWRHAQRWNPWIASRAFGYWRYQLFVRRGQSAFNVMNCISGSNSMYRSGLLAELTSQPTPYIVDDTYWTLETHRRRLGRIVYAPGAVAAVQDPADLRSWYRQNLRWLWGTMQGIHGHRVGRTRSWFDVAYLGLILDWLLYVLLWPALLLISLRATDLNLAGSLGLYAVGYLAWAAAGAIALRRWRLIVLTPLIIVIDWIYRAIYVHAFIKTIRQPRVEHCVWDSPTRYETAA